MVLGLSKIKRLVQPKRDLVRIEVPVSDTYLLLNNVIDYPSFEPVVIDKQSLQEQTRIQHLIEKITDFRSRVSKLISILGISLDKEPSLDPNDSQKLYDLNGYANSLGSFLTKHESNLLFLHDKLIQLEREQDVLNFLSLFIDGLSSRSITLDLLTSSKETFTAIGHIPSSFEEIIRFYINEITTEYYFLWSVDSPHSSDWRVIICVSLIEYKDRIMSILSDNHFVPTTIDKSLFASVDKLDGVEITERSKKVSDEIKAIKKELNNLSSSIGDLLLRNLAIINRALILLQYELEGRSKNDRFTIWCWIKKKKFEDFSALINANVPSASLLVLTEIPFDYQKSSSVAEAIKQEKERHKKQKKKKKKKPKKEGVPKAPHTVKTRKLPLFPEKGIFVRLETPQENLRKFVGHIRKLGILHPIKITGPSEELVEKVNDQRKELESLKSRIEGISNKVDFTPSPHLDKKFMLEDDFEHSKAFISNFLTDYESKLLDLTTEISELDTKIQQLEFYKPFHAQFVQSGIKVDLFKGGAETLTKLGSIPKKRLKAVKFFCEQVTDYNLLFWSSEIKPKSKKSKKPKSKKPKRVNVLIVSLKEYEGAIDRVLSEYSFTPVSLQNEDIIAEEPSIEDLIVRLKSHKAELNEKLNAIIQESSTKFFACKELIKLEEERLWTYEYCYINEGKAILWGWIPSSKQKELVNSLKPLPFRVEVTIRDEPPLSMPTITKTGKTFKVVRGIIEGMGVPNSHEIDPYFFIRFTFPFLFGIMFADLAHGIMLALFGAYLTIRKKRKKVPLDESLTGYLYRGAEFLIFCGSAAAIFGILFGSFLGDEKVLPHLYQQWGVHWLPIIHPLENIKLLLLISLLIGFVFMQLTIWLKVIRNIVYGHGVSSWLAPVMTSLYYVTIFTFLYTFVGEGIYWEVFDYHFPVLPKTLKTINVILLGVTLILMYVVGFLHARGEGLIEALDHMFALISNTLSFSRLMALLLVHAILSAIPYDMFHIPVLTVGWWIAGLLTALFLILPLEGLLSYLNTLRLHWVELFTKFFEGNGTPYKPLKERLFYIELRSMSVM